MSKDFMCNYDETASIGKRYRRQDEIGTPYCVTVRDRDTMEQERVNVNDLQRWISERIKF